MKWATQNKDLLGLTQAKPTFAWGAWNSYVAERLMRLVNAGLMVVIVVQLGEEYKNDEATGVKTPKTWAALDQNAMLVLWLQRVLDPTSDQPGVPRALVLKDRAQWSVDAFNDDGMWEFDPSDGNLPARVVELVHAELARIEHPGYYQKVTVPILPPAIPKADWAHIWGYWERPYDPYNPKPEEQLTAEERQIVIMQPSEYDKLLSSAAAFQAEQQLRDSRATSDRASAEIKYLLASYGEDGSKVKDWLRTHFGAWSFGAHEDIMRALEWAFGYPDAFLEIYPARGSLACVIETGDCVESPV